MENVNPYSPPSAGVADVVLSSQETARLNRIAANQRLMIYSVAGSWLTGILRAFVGDAALLVIILVSVLAIVGAVRLAAALGHALWLRVAYAILMIIPLINLLAMLVLSSRATKALRAGGYRVGLLGAKSRKA